MIIQNDDNNGTVDGWRCTKSGRYFHDISAHQVLEIRPLSNSISEISVAVNPKVSRSGTFTLQTKRDLQPGQWIDAQIGTAYNGSTGITTIRSFRLVGLTPPEFVPTDGSAWTAKG